MIGAVRLRQFADRLRHQLSFIPTVYVVGAIVLVQGLLWIDRGLDAASIPEWLETSVEGARSVFAAIAGGLITSTTLLLSMMLVAVQLASSQFSPRTLRNWLGDGHVQHAVGFVLGTTVFCLLALRSTRSLEEGQNEVIPHVTVLIAVALGVLSLIAVVRTVDHITHTMRIDSITRRVATETIAVVHRVAPAGSAPIHVVVESGAVRSDGSIDVPLGAAVLETDHSGWIQQIDDDAIMRMLPEHSTGYVTVTVGSFVTCSSPIMWVAPAPADLDACRASMPDAVAVGDSRTMQQDVEFGVVQLTDIAVRALSPGINDPSTASDVIVHLGNVMTTLWEHPASTTTLRSGSRTLVRYRPTHADLLDRAFSPIIHYGREDRQVVTTLKHALRLLRSEIDRRDLPGPVEPVDAMLAALD